MVTMTYLFVRNSCFQNQEIPAVSYLEDVQLFLDSRGHSEVATKVGSLMDTVVSLQYGSLASARQATLDEFF